MLVKINTADTQGLSGLGISYDTVNKINTAKNNGFVFRSASDFAALGIPQYEIDILSNHVSYEEPAPEQNMITVNLSTQPSPLPEYTVHVQYTDRNTGGPVQDIYFLDHDGTTKLLYDERIAAEPFVLFIKAPDGGIVETELNGSKALQHEFTKSQFTAVSLLIHSGNVIEGADGAASRPARIRGKLIAADPSLHLESVQIVFLVATAKDENGAPDFYPVCFAQTETDGYFFSSPLNFRAPGDHAKILSAKAQVAVAGDPEIPVRLQFSEAAGGDQTTGQLPERVILYLENSAAAGEAGADDCGCGCSDLNFHNKKVLDEFSYFTVVRTTEPLIKATEISDVEEVQLSDLIEGVVTDQKIRDQLAGLKAPRALLRSFVGRYGIITQANVNKLVQMIQHKKLKSKLQKKETPFNGRLALDGKHSVDWDDKPTIYEAVSISHGHLLHFKQEWISDGYSLGDLLYSLPLAPGQKKQVVVFDWDRRDSASNTQQLDYQESLYNTLSRDRDVNEVAKATVKERSFGASLAGAGGRAGGEGGLKGALLTVAGIASGFGLAGSIAGQRSSRDVTSSSQQHVNDRTVQAASAVRSQRSTVIQTVSQGERFEVSAESVANYNHCHAMTMQYFEVLRHFQVGTRLAHVQECLFVPLEFSPFDRKKAMRWREILSANLIKPELEPGFAATERIEDELSSAAENYYDSIGYPQNNYAEKTLNYIDGELYMEFQLERPLDKLDGDSWLFEPDNWTPYFSFLGGLNPQTFFDRYIKNQQQKDENFFKYAGPSIAQGIIDSLRFYAKGGQGAVRLPIDATLLSTFVHRRKLNVSLRMSGDFIAAVKRENIDFIEIRIEADAVLMAKLKELMRNVRVIVHSGTMQYRTDIAGDYLFRNADIRNDLTPEGDNVRIHTPLNANEMRSPRKEDALACNALLHHLNENLEYYHQAIWMQMDEQRRFMLLDGIIAPGKANGRSVASVVENKLIGIVGNCLVLPVAPGFRLDPTHDESIDLYQHYYQDPLDQVRISLPTKGVFAEAVMGKCNSCEKKDETRFWRWEESPVPDSPTAINTITTPVPQNTQPNLQAKDFAAPIINLQNAPAIPDPQGYGGLLQLLNNPNIFRDLTGLNENQKNALAAFQASMTGAQNYASMAKDLAMQQANQKHSASIVDAIRNSPDLTQEEKAGLIKDHFKQLIDGGESKRTEQAAANSKPTLSDVAARAEEKGKSVKATSTDPAGKTETLEVGGGAGDKNVLAEVKGMLLKLKQKNEKACWATAVTIMMSWKMNDELSIEDALAEAGDFYLEKFQAGKGLKASEKLRFISALNMEGEAPASYPLSQYIDWINTYGPLWITTDSLDADGPFSPHARILVKITGGHEADITGAEFTFIDPWTGTEKTEPFEKFLTKYEQMVTDNRGDLYIQVVHFAFEEDDESVEGGGADSTYYDLAQGGLFDVSTRYTDEAIKENGYRPWLDANLAQKSYFADEPLPNMSRYTFPTWINAEQFYMAFKELFPEEADLIIGERTSPVTAKYFVIHDTDGTKDMTAENVKSHQKGIHLWLGTASMWQQIDWHLPGAGAKIETSKNTCFVHIELTRHRKMLEEVPNVKADGTLYTYRQYLLLAFAYVTASLRSGKLLIVTYHREVDRGVWIKVGNKVKHGHGDPVKFDIEFFYKQVSWLLNLPEFFSFGIEKDRASLESNRADHKNVFIDFVKGNVPYANQYGTITMLRAKDVSDTKLNTIRMNCSQ